MEPNVDWSDCPAVETVPGRMNGRPVVKHSRVPADTIVECNELGESAEEIASDYRVPLEDVKTILVYHHAHHTEPAPTI